MTANDTPPVVLEKSDQINVSPVIEKTDQVTQSPGGKPPYSAFPPKRRSLILGIVTSAGFLGPLAGGIYLPVLPELERDFGVSATVINATVSVFMVVFAFAVSFKLCRITCDALH